MLVQYVRCNGVPVACVAAVGTDAVGFMVVQPNLPTPSKWFMREVAIGRALHTKVDNEYIRANCPNRLIGYTVGDEYRIDNVTNVITEAVERMRQRAEKYYKVEALS